MTDPKHNRLDILAAFADELKGSIGLDGRSPMHVQETKPADSVSEVGDLWYKDTSHKLFLLTSDGWIEIAKNGAIGLEGEPGKNGKIGKPGLKGSDGRDGKDADLGEVRVIASVASKDEVKVHETKFDHTLIDPFLVGSKKLSEAGMSDGMVIQYDQARDTLGYAPMKAVASQLSKFREGKGLSLPSQTGNSGKFLTTNGSKSSWSSVPSAITIKDEGVTLTATPTSVDFVGAGVTATAVGTAITVSVSGTPGGTDTQVQFNDSSSFGGDAGFTYNKTTDTGTIGSLLITAASSLTLGTASANAGAILLKNATNANTLTIQSGVTSASYVLTLPLAQGGASTFLQNNGSGALSWATALTGITVGTTTFTSGTTGSVLFVGASSVVQQDNSNLYWDDTANRLGIGSTTLATAKLTITSIGTASEGGFFVKAASTSTNFANDYAFLGLWQTTNSANNYARLDFYDANGAAAAQIIGLYTSHDTSTADLIFRTSAVERFRISSATQTGLLTVGTNTVKGLVIKGAASQSASLQEWQKSDTTIYAAMSATGVFSTYNSVATAAWGIPAIYGSGRSTAQTGDVASVATYTVGAADGSFLISANFNVTAYTAGTQSVQCTYTDETNTSRTFTFTFSNLTGTLATAIGATGPYESFPAHIRCKASTAITIKTVGTAWTGTYNVESLITQIA